MVKCLASNTIVKAIQQGFKFFIIQYSFKRFFLFFLEDSCSGLYAKAYLVSLRQIWLYLSGLGSCLSVEGRSFCLSGKYLLHKTVAGVGERCLKLEA